ASTIPARRRGPAPRARSARSSSTPESRAAARRKCRRPPAVSCPRAASTGARRSPPLSGFPSGWAEKTATIAWSVLGESVGYERKRSETGSGAKTQGQGQRKSRQKQRIYGGFGDETGALAGRSADQRTSKSSSSVTRWKS